MEGVWSEASWWHQTCLNLDSYPMFNMRLLQIICQCSNAASPVMLEFGLSFDRKSRPQEFRFLRSTFNKLIGSDRSSLRYDAPLLIHVWHFFTQPNAGKHVAQNCSNAPNAPMFQCVKCSKAPMLYFYTSERTHIAIADVSLDRNIWLHFLCHQLFM